MMLFNLNYLLLALPGLLIGIWAQIKLHSTYKKYSEVPVESGQTGAETARRILDSAGLHDMPVEEGPGSLSDHDEPAERAVFFASDNFHGTSVATIGVAAHETGHALQHKAAYGLF